MAQTGTTATKPTLITLQGRGQWAGGVRTDVHFRHFDPVITDEPADLGGTDAGPNPMEYLLAALMGCETVLMSIVAEEHHFSFDGIEYDLSGELDPRGFQGVEGVRPYFSKIKGTVKVTTNDDPELLQTVAKAAERRCPVYRTLEAADVAFEVDWIAVKP